MNRRICFAAFALLGLARGCIAAPADSLASPPPAAQASMRAPAAPASPGPPAGTAGADTVKPQSAQDVATASARAPVSLEVAAMQEAAPASSRQDATAGSVRVLVAPEQEATLFSQGIGRIRDVDASLGSRFKAGETLVTFDCDEQLARLKMSQAELSAARETHSAKLRLQGLQSAGELEVSLAAAAAQKAEAQVNLYRAQQAYCVVKAPFNGRVVKLHVKSYEGVNQNAPLLDIISDGPLKLRLNAPSGWLRWLKAGTSFQVRIDETGKEYPARVTAVNGRVDAVSQSVELEGVIAGPAADLLPGMSGTAHFAPGS